MSLADKIEEVEDRKGFEYAVITLEAVKEFIKKILIRLSEKYDTDIFDDIVEIVEEEAGPKLLEAEE